MPNFIDPQDFEPQFPHPFPDVIIPGVSPDLGEEDED